MKHILKCQKCGTYTLNKVCKCGGEAVNSRPPKFGLEDRFGDYRRKYKEAALKKQGLL